jgi:diacylglycerol kinase family enzyme
MKVAEISISEVSLPAFNIDGEVYSAKSLRISILPDAISYLGEPALSLSDR